MFDSEQLQAALQAAQELTAESSVAEYRAALSSVAPTAETLHMGLRKENAALRIEYLKIDELKPSHSRAREAREPAHNAVHWDNLQNDDNRREHIAYEVEASQLLNLIQ